MAGVQAPRGQASLGSRHRQAGKEAVSSREHCIAQVARAMVGSQVRGQGTGSVRSLAWHWG